MLNKVTCKLRAETKRAINVKNLNQTRKSIKRHLVYYSVARLPGQKIYSKGKDGTPMTRTDFRESDFTRV